MQSRRLNINDLPVRDEDIYLAMGYRGHVPDDTILRLLDDVKTEIKTHCTPQYMYRIEEGYLSDKRHLTIGDKIFNTGGIIASYLKGVTTYCLFVATAGKEYDAYIHHLKQSDIVKEFVADALGSVIAEAGVEAMAKDIGISNPELRQSLPYSPGYCGWNIMEQSKLFSFFPDMPCGITLTDSFLMSPVKSVSGIIGLGETLKPQPYHCELCKNKNCYKRKEESK